MSVYTEHDILFLYPERSCISTTMIIQLPDHWKGVAEGWQIVFSEDFEHNWRKRCRYCSEANASREEEYPWILMLFYLCPNLIITITLSLIQMT